MPKHPNKSDHLDGDEDMGMFGTGGVGFGRISREKQSMTTVSAPDDFGMVRSVEANDGGREADSVMALTGMAPLDPMLNDELEQRENKRKTVMAPDASMANPETTPGEMGLAFDGGMGSSHGGKDMLETLGMGNGAGESMMSSAEMSRSMSPVNPGGRFVYRTAEEARGAARDLGLSGVHKHTMANGETVFMPGSSHSKLNKRLREKGMRPAPMPR